MSPSVQIADDLWLEPDDFASHLHGVGLSRTGKSKLIELILRDFVTKRVPFCLIDPHGTLYNAMLDWQTVMKSTGRSLSSTRPATASTPSTHPA